MIAGRNYNYFVCVLACSSKPFDNLLLLSKLSRRGFMQSHNTANLAFSIEENLKLTQEEIWKFDVVSKGKSPADILNISVNATWQTINENYVFKKSQLSETSYLDSELLLLAYQILSNKHWHDYYYHEFLDYKKRCKDFDSIIEETYIQPEHNITPEEIFGLAEKKSNSPYRQLADANKVEDILIFLDDISKQNKPRSKAPNIEQIYHTLINNFPKEKFNEIESAFRILRNINCWKYYKTYWKNARGKRIKKYGASLQRNVTDSEITKITLNQSRFFYQHSQPSLHNSNCNSLEMEPDHYATNYVFFQPHPVNNQNLYITNCQIVLPN